jgi:hypothetical protein
LASALRKNRVTVTFKGNATEGLSAAEDNTTTTCMYGMLRYMHYKLLSAAKAQFPDQGSGIGIEII